MLRARIWETKLIEDLLSLKKHIGLKPTFRVFIGMIRWSSLKPLDF